MKTLTFVSALFLMIGCGASNLNKSLSEVTGENIMVIRSYPANKFTALSGNTVYTYSQSSSKGSGCEIYFEVNNQNIIILTSWKGEACNSFYDDTLKPKQ